MRKMREKKMGNDLYVVEKRQTSLTGKTYSDIRGFDYKDDKTGFSINVRDGDAEIRIFGKLIDISKLEDFVEREGLKHG